MRASSLRGEETKRWGGVKRVAWLSFFVADGLLILLTLGGLLARYVPPHRGWWLQVLAVALPVLGGALLAAALVAMRSNAWWAGLHVALALVVLGRLVSVGSSRGSGETAAGTTLTVMSYNAGGLPDPLPASGEDLRVRLRTVAPDVVAWQEQQAYVPDVDPDAIVAQSGFRDLVSALQHHIPTLPRNEKLVRNPVTTGLVASPQEVVAVSDLDREENPGSATRVEIEWGGRRFALYSVHLHSFTRRPKPGSRRAWIHPETWWEALRAMRTTFLLQEGEARRLRQRLDAEPLPYLLCGDFNATANNWAYAHLVSGLTDAFAADGLGVGATYSARWPWVRIDYVLASPEWEVTSAQTLRVSASDHLPLVVRLRWRTTEAEPVAPTPSP